MNNPLVLLRTHQVTLNGRRNQYVVALAPAENPGLHELIDRVAALTQRAREYFQQHAGNGQPLELSIVIEHVNQVRLVQVFGHQFGIRQTFTSVEQIQQMMPQALWNAFENLAQSAGDIELHQLLFYLRYDNMAMHVYGRVKGYIKRAIANPQVGGLAPYASTSEQLCAYQAIIKHLMGSAEARALWTGSFDWFTQVFGSSRIHEQNLFMKRLIDLSTGLRNALQFDEWNVAIGPNSSCMAFVKQQPQYQIVVYNQNTRQLYDHCRGALCIEADKHSTIILSLTLGHVHLVKFPHKYFTHGYNTFYCYKCLTFKPTPHACVRSLTCNKCFNKFIDAEHFDRHQQYGQKIARCEACLRRFYNQQCLDSHKCDAAKRLVCTVCGRVEQTTPHMCDEYTCATCNKRVVYPHKCYLTKFEAPEQIEPAKAGEHYYAFDFESMFTPLEDGGNLHTVNLVVVRQCFTELRWVFQTLDEFYTWLMTLTSLSTFFAHNLKGYDGRLMFEYLFDKHVPPQECVWNGAKLMQMTYGRITFQDTLLHFPNTLEQLPKVFGLDPARFKKGFFPYKFNVAENQDYVGPIPDADYFDPGNMARQKRAEFERWYVEQAGVVYDFHQELVDYCISDTDLLCKAIEAYMIQQMATSDLNPWESMTIASYAMTMYRTYYMPENTIAVLTNTQDKEIRLAMHGGRTDSRRLLREWSDEEVNNGYYARYQDVQSLYPTVQFYDPMPVGHTEKIVWAEDAQPSTEQVRAIFGFVCVDIHPTRYLHHPVLVEIDPDTDRLVAALKPLRRVVIPTPELNLALDNGYLITRVHYSYHFEQSTELFKDYFRVFIKAKLEASGVPSYIQTDEQWLEFQRYHRDELGIELERDKMVSNSGRKTGAKLLCNSLWGKFGERNHNSVWKMFRTGDQDDKVLEMENNWLEGFIDVNYHRYTRDGNAVGMVYSRCINPENENSNDVFNAKRRGKRNIAIAAMVTSHARCRLWTELNKLGNRVLYHDTDSIIYENSPFEYNISEGKYLGEWEDECDGCPIVAFTSTGPKCYSYKKRKPDGSLACDTKVKGFTLNSNTADLINYESMRALVTGEEEQIVSQCLSFQYDMQHGTMVTQNVAKVFRKTYEKGYVEPDSFIVRPFGWEMFSEYGDAA